MLFKNKILHKEMTLSDFKSALWKILKCKK